MSYKNQFPANVTGEQQYQGLLERVLFSTLTTVPCCVFLFINGTMLFTLRSKSVFRETSRYILLFNLLFADTVQLALSQLMYLTAASRVTLTYPVCGFLNMVGDLSNEVSPLTLVVMSLERYVAVCYPLRHATIITIRNTAVAIIVVWTFSSLNVLIRVLLLLDFPFSDLDTLQMRDFCSDLAMLLGPMSDIYDKAYTCFLFLSAGVAVISSYIGVVIAARSASTDKASASKARNTLLLHLVQLGLSLSSTIYSPMLIALSRIVTRIVLVRVQNVLYVCVFIFPRCLSSLIYGIRDQTIRPVLMYHLCCRLKRSVVTAKAAK
ncbi:odorant receptor 131-2-like [Dicentrarchus labrax]|uniref:G-protein coupled receptors family 1 profile domain-containing protein n=1 Tax=Dicentrarchus labrax TaxID=13489 RepID=A0A8C4EZV0_DICLA|nr:odorant receptor 131-2-like [Dicentrarchus labrax]